MTALTTHVPSLGSEPPPLGPSHWAVTLETLQGLTSIPCDPMSEPLVGDSEKSFKGRHFGGL